MKPVFKCEYCKFMGTEQEVREHEIKCFDNYDRKSCVTCVHKQFAGMNYKCDCGKEIPQGKLIEFCDKYERKEKPEYPLCDLFGNIFGGVI